MGEFFETSRDFVARKCPFLQNFFAKISQKFCDEINLQFRWNFDFIESKKKDFRGTPNSGRKICYL
jgi:hypothetical protein